MPINSQHKTVFSFISYLFFTIYKNEAITPPKATIVIHKIAVHPNLGNNLCGTASKRQNSLCELLLTECQPSLKHQYISRRSRHFIGILYL